MDIDFLSDLGARSLLTVWTPLLVWTLAGALVLAVLHLKKDRHPLYHYHARLALLLALPLGFLAMPLSDFSLPLTMHKEVVEPFLSVDFLPDLPASIHTTAAMAPIPASWSAFTWMGLMVVVALLAAGGSLIKLAADWWALQRLRRRLPNVAQFPVQAQAQALHIRRPVQCIIAPNDNPPYTFGWLRPVVVIPRILLDDPEQFDTALTHELIHVQRHDYLFRCIERLLQSILIIHPGLGRLCRQIDQYREMSCDAEVLAQHQIPTKAYASMLFAMLRNHIPETTLAPHLARLPSTLSLRIRALKTYSRNHHDRRRINTRSLLMAGLLFLSVTALVSCSESVITAEPTMNRNENRSEAYSFLPIHQAVTSIPADVL